MLRLSLVIAILLSSTFSGAAEHAYSTATIVDVQHKTRQKTDLYLVNTPVMSEVPYVEMRLHLENTEYTVEYTSHHGEQLPSAWIPAAEVPVRIEKHLLFAQRQDGTEVRSIITKHQILKGPH